MLVADFFTVLLAFGPRRLRLVRRGALNQQGTFAGCTANPRTTCERVSQARNLVVSPDERA